MKGLLFVAVAALSLSGFSAVTEFTLNWQIASDADWHQQVAYAGIYYSIDSGQEGRWTYLVETDSDWNNATWKSVVSETGLAPFNQQILTALSSDPNSVKFYVEVATANPKKVPEAQVLYTSERYSYQQLLEMNVFDVTGNAGESKFHTSTWIVGQAVPEPSGGLLTLLGLAMLSLRRKKV